MDLASQALRTIAIGFKPLSTETIFLSEHEAEKTNFYWFTRND